MSESDPNASGEVAQRAADEEPSEFEVWEGEGDSSDLAASCWGPRPVAWKEACQYAAQYAQDGPVRVCELTRRWVHPERLMLPEPPPAASGNAADARSDKQTDPGVAESKQGPENGLERALNSFQNYCFGFFQDPTNHHAERRMTDARKAVVALATPKAEHEPALLEFLDALPLEVWAPKGRTRARKFLMDRALSTSPRPPKP